MEAVCGSCSGTGWKPVEKGGLSGVAACDCQKKVRGDAMVENAGIPRNYTSACFESIEAGHLTDDPVVYTGFAGALLAARAYAQNFGPGSNPPGLMIVGPHGTGKTHIAISVLRRVALGGKRALFYDCGHLLEDMRDRFGSKESGKSEAMMAAYDTELLVLDDIGAQTERDWSRDAIGAMITHRYNNRKALVATCFNERDLGKLGERIESRLVEMCKFLRVPAGTEDFRSRQKQKRERYR